MKYLSKIIFRQLKLASFRMDFIYINCDLSTLKIHFTVEKFFTLAEPFKGLIIYVQSTYK